MANWIVVDYTWGSYVRCSACGEEFTDEGEHMEYHYRFCPWCGAKMDGTVKEELGDE